MLSRILILIVAVATLAPVASAQRVFRASSIDLEQNERIDSLEAKVSRIESSVSKLVASLEKQSQPVATASQPATVTPVSVIAQAPTIRQPSSQSGGYYSQAELIAIVQQAYPRGDYTRYADVSPRSGVWNHLQDGNHQFTAAQVQGLPQDIALGLHGLHHANKIRATRSSRAAAPQVAYSQPAIQQSYPQPAIQQSYSQPVIQAAGGCANGQCARPSYSQPARRSFGIFRR
jgi:hypothetical protein